MNYEVYTNEIYYYPMWSKEQNINIDLYGHRTIVGNFFNKKQAEEAATAFQSWMNRTQLTPRSHYYYKPHIKIYESNMDMLLEFYGS